MNEQDKAFNELISILSEANVLPYVMIVGSWAEYLYSKCDVLLYDFSLKTQDIDILIPNIRHPSNKINLVDALENHGFLPIYYNNGLIKFNFEGSIELEFLARELNKGQLEPYQTNLSIPAQGLRHLEILLFSPTSVKFNGVNLIVPTPEAYVLHKLVINSERRSMKQEKDIDSISRVINACLNNRPKFFETLKHHFYGLTLKQKKKVKSTCQTYPIRLASISSFVDKLPFQCNSNSR